jgi:hypothetical protein
MLSVRDPSLQALLLFFNPPEPRLAAHPAPALGCAQQQTIGQRAHLHRVSTSTPPEQSTVDLPAQPARERRESGTHAGALSETKAYDALGRPVPMRKLRLRHAVKTVNALPRAPSPSPSPTRLRHSPRAEPVARSTAHVQTAKGPAHVQTANGPAHPPQTSLPSFESMASPAKSAAAAHALTCLANAGRSRPLFAAQAQATYGPLNPTNGTTSASPLARPPTSHGKGIDACSSSPSPPLDPNVSTGHRSGPLRSELEALINTPSQSVDQTSRSAALPSLDEILSSQYGAMAQMLLAAGVAMGMGMRPMWPSSSAAPLTVSVKCESSAQAASPAAPPHPAGAWSPKPSASMAQPPSEHHYTPAQHVGFGSPAVTLNSTIASVCMPGDTSSGWVTPTTNAGQHVDRRQTSAPLASPSPPEQVCASSMMGRPDDERPTPLFAVPKGPAARLHQPHNHSDLRAARASFGSPGVSKIRPGLSIWHQASPTGTPPSVACHPRSTEPLPLAHARHDTPLSHAPAAPGLSSRHALFGQQSPAERSSE